MSAARELALRFRSLFKADAADRLDEEVENHVALLTDEYVARGMDQADARRTALRELGNLTALRQQYREQSSLPLVENFWLDLKYTLRTLRRNPAFTVSCISTLTIGLGCMIAILCVVSTMLWKPLPYPDAHRLVIVNETDPHSGAWPFSEPDLLDLHERAHSLDAVGAFRTTTLSLTGAGEPATIQSAAVTSSLFGMLGIVPVAGTTLHESAPNVFISRRLWESKWQNQRSIIRGTVILNGDHYTVCGVGNLPGDLLPGVDFLFPLLPKSSESRSAREVQMLARVKPDVSLGQAQAELNNIAKGIGSEHALTNAGWGFRVTPISAYIVGPATSRMVWMILGAVALLWLLACSNVAGLQLARSVTRKQEMGTRLCLGASRGRLMSQSLVENLVISAAGGVFGLVVAELAITAIRTLVAGFLPRLASLDLDFPTVLIAGGCMIACTLFAGVVSGNVPLYQGDRGISSRSYGRDALVVFQVALTTVLMLGATLLLRSYVRLNTVDPGFDPEHILTVRVSNQAEPVTRFQSVLDQVQNLPVISAVGATNILPFSGQGTGNRFRLEGEATSAEYRSAAWRSVTPGFFAALGIPLKSGRLFTAADKDGSLEVVIISESMARQYWPNQNPVGQRLLWGKSGNPKTIVGVVGDLRDLAVDSAPVPTMFRPFDQLLFSPMTLTLRTKGDPADAIATVRRAIWNADPNVALTFAPVRQAMADSIMDKRDSLMAVSTFTLVSLTIAAFGLYGLISYHVNQRRNEIGIRLALGATASRILWDVQSRCLRLVLLGAAIGLPLAFGGTRWMSSLLYGTDGMEWWAIVAVLAAFLVVGIAAGLGPAYRAAQTDAAAALRV